MLTDGLHEEIICAGFGGQGIILLGKLLATAAMKENYQVTFMSSYGAEVRGGTANCMVVISEEPIASPLVCRPDTVIAMNTASMRKFTPLLKPSGLLVINSSLVDTTPQRDDIEVLLVRANELADELNSTRSANMVALGAYLQKRRFIDIDKVADCLKDTLPPRWHDTIPTNTEALRRGGQLVTAATV
jgi:2-oxoglutarate ferredoxin oxidoreductase subunit gamma